MTSPPRRPRVLHIIESLRPYGAQHGVLSACLALADRYEPVVFAFADGDLRDRFTAEGITVETEIAAPPYRGGLGSRFAAVWRAIRRTRPDLVNGHMLSGNVAGGIVAHALGLPVVVHVRGPEHREGSLAYRYAYRLARMGRTRLLACSEGRARAFRSLTGLPCQVIYNAINANGFADGATVADLRGELGLTEGAPLVGTIARCSPQKNHHLLLEAAAIVRDRRPDAHFVAVGDGELRPRLEKVSRELGLAGRFHFLGERRDVPALMRSWDAFVLSSMEEGLPRAVLEAMWSRLPVVATDVVGTNEVVVDGQTGFLTPLGDPGRLAERLCQVLSSPELARRFGGQGHDRVRRLFSLEAMAAELDRVYQNLLRDPPPR